MTIERRIIRLLRVISVLIAVLGAWLSGGEVLEALTYHQWSTEVGCLANRPVNWPDRLGSVRTPLVGSSCPVSKEQLLRGRQTVCSGRCRARRWRQAHVARDPEILVALQTIVAVARGIMKTITRPLERDPGGG